MSYPFENHLRINQEYYEKDIDSIISVILLSVPAVSADFTIQIDPAPNTVGDAQVSQISSSKIANFSTDVVSAIMNTLSNYLLKSEMKAPTVTRLTINSGTYFPPQGVVWIEVEMVCGGGGGGGGPIANGDSGSPTAFGTNLLIANGGGIYGNATCTINSPARPVTVLQGSQGGKSNYGGGWSYVTGAEGGSSPFGGFGGLSGYSPGRSALQNTGSGGGGGGSNTIANAYGGQGGGSGCYIKAIIPNPTGSYPWYVGSGGPAGPGSGVNLWEGGAGGSGIIIIKEHYQ